MLEQMEKVISTESISKTDMEKEDAKPCTWWYRFAERCLSLESVANDKIVVIDADAKNYVRNVTLQIADKKGVPGPILRRPITN